MTNSLGPPIGNSGMYLFGGQSTGVVYNNDLWSLNEFTGSFNWQLLAPTPSTPVPAGRQRASLAYHAGLQRIYLFGGDNSVSYFGDTWYWQNGRWFQVTASSSPPARTGAALVYEATSSRLVLIGGANASRVFDDVWEFDGASWFQRPTPFRPGARVNHSVVFDRNLGKSILFGGASTAKTFGDTWTYDGKFWAPVVGGGRTPSPRHAHAACYDDRGSRRMVVFGGVSGATSLGDTYEFDGSRWYDGGTGPVARYNAAMVFDHALNQCVLFGGTTGSTPLADTWVYRPAFGQWQHVNIPGPSPREIHAMAYDRIRQRTVLFGGFGQTGNFLDDTWELDTSSAVWIQRNPATKPIGRRNHTMAWDEARGRVVLFGGGDANSNLRRDCWEWDGNNWVERMPETLLPSGREDAVMTYDARRGRLVAISGATPARVDEIWELWSPVDPAGRGHATNNLPLTHLSQPALGNLFDLEFDNPQNLGVLLVGAGPVQVPLLSVPAGLFCQAGSIYTDLTITIPQSSPVVRLRIPNHQDLVGQTLVIQAAMLRPGNCLGLTDAVHATIQVP